MLYHFIAANKEGKLEEADLEAASLEDVLRYLAGRDLRPVSVKSLRTERSGIFGRLGKITLEDKVFLSKYLALMLRVGTDLLQAINILIADFEKPAMKNFLLEVRENLSQGKPFYEAFARHPQNFSLVMVNLLKAAETSGNLQGTFETLSVSLAKEAELRSKVRSALIYPVIILSASMGLFVFLATFALPRIADVFMKGGIEPPFFSRVVFTIGLFVGDNVAMFLLTLAALIGFFIWFVFYNALGRAITARILTRTPGVRKLYEEIAVQRFASTFASLLRAGLPIVEATKITADVVDADAFRAALMRIADEGLTKGLTIGEAFRRETVFPKVVTNLIAISEKAGHLTEVLETLSDFYASNVDAGVKTMVAFLEPALLLFMGIMVGGIALSIIVPIYQLTAQF